MKRLWTLISVSIRICNFSLFIHLLAAVNEPDDENFGFTQLSEFRLRISGLGSATVPRGLQNADGIIVWISTCLLNSVHSLVRAGVTDSDAFQGTRFPFAFCKSRAGSFLCICLSFDLQGVQKSFHRLMIRHLIALSRSDLCHHRTCRCHS
jgi:hypothetical protein